MGILFKAEDSVCIYILWEAILQAILTHMNTADCTYTKYSSKWKKKKKPNQTTILPGNQMVLKNNLARDYLWISIGDFDLELIIQIK